MLDARLLHYFLVVAREQNMTRAAAELHIAQPTLSAQIAQLEKQLGLKLFIRTNKSTILTEDGVMFRARAQELMDLMNKVENEFSIGDGDISGDVYFGAAETHIMGCISDVFRSIRKEYPNIRFHIYSGDAQAILERLDKGLLDIGLLLGADNQEKYDYTPLGRFDTWGLLVPDDCEIAHKDTVTVDELPSLPLLLSNQYMASERHLFLPDGKKQTVVGSYNLITNATYMVEQGLGYALCLADLVNTEGRHLRFIPIDTDIRTESYIVTKKYAYFSKAAKLLLKKLDIS